MGQCKAPLWHETQAFLVHRDIQPVKQPAYSPDLNLCDRFLFRKIKHRLLGYDFRGHEDVKDCMQRVVRSLPEDELFQQLKKLRGHSQTIIEAGGDYVTWLYSYLNAFINSWVLLVQSKSFQLNLVCLKLFGPSERAWQGHTLCYIPLYVRIQ